MLRTKTKQTYKIINKSVQSIETKLKMELRHRDSRFMNKVKQVS